MKTQMGVLSILVENDSNFKLFKRKRVGYRFMNFRKEPKDLSEISCKTSPSYFILSSGGESDPGVLCGRVVVCHSSGEKNIYSMSDFFTKYTVAESSNTAYPVPHTVKALVPTKTFVRGLGDNNSFINFWGRKDVIDTNSVVIKNGEGQYYVKTKIGFDDMYTGDTRDRRTILQRDQIVSSTEAIVSNEGRNEGRTNPNEGRNERRTNPNEGRTNPNEGRTNPNERRNEGKVLIPSEKKRTTIRKNTRNAFQKRY